MSPCQISSIDDMGNDDATSQVQNLKWNVKHNVLGICEYSNCKQLAWGIYLHLLKRKMKVWAFIINFES